MTVPTLMNCSHQENGWCLECVAQLADDRDKMLRELEIIIEKCDNCHDGNIIGDEWPAEIPCPMCSGARSFMEDEIDVEVIRQRLNEPSMSLKRLKKELGL